MGMSIDEAIGYNKNLKMYMEINDEHDEYKFLEENHIALEMAIETMRKYQKIEQIINYPVYIQEDVLRYKMICEVVGKKNIKQTEQDDNEEDG